jgi:hypothetical protein
MQSRPAAQALGTSQPPPPSHAHPASGTSAVAAEAAAVLAPQSEARTLKEKARSLPGCCYSKWTEARSLPRSPSALGSVAASMVARSAVSASAERSCWMDPSASRIARWCFATAHAYMQLCARARAYTWRSWQGVSWSAGRGRAAEPGWQPAAEDAWCGLEVVALGPLSARDRPPQHQARQGTGSALAAQHVQKKGRGHEALWCAQHANQHSEG